MSTSIKDLEMRLEVLMCQRRDYQKQIKQLQLEIGKRYVELTTTDGHYALTHRFTFQSHAEMAHLVHDLQMAEESFNYTVAQIIKVKEELKIQRKELAK